MEIYFFAETMGGQLELGAAVTNASALCRMLHGREVTMLAPKALKHEIGALLADGLAFQKEDFPSR